MTKKALLLIDFQNDYYPTFQGSKWPLVGVEKASENAAKLLKAFREKNLPVIYIQHESVREGAPFFLKNTEGFNIHSSVAPLANEKIVIKQQVNSFKNTKLKEVLDNENVTELYIVGAMSHMCIDAATRAASDFGFVCHLAHDACATRDLVFNGETIPASQVHASFMSALGFAYAHVASTSELLSSI